MKKATIAFSRDKVVGPIRRRLFGSFVEHLGRGVYGGIYEPGHPTANHDGFRQDVIDLVHELGVTTLRYPGGNFVSGYNWEDGIGPKEDRPVRLDLAWQMLETNQIGTDEFARFCQLTDTEFMMAVNLGTRGIAEALQLLEYTNHPSGTALTDQRTANGYPNPHNIRMWCLGNEMDGDWQIGFLDPDSYGHLAARTARAMRNIDPTLELVAVGSSYSGMPLFGEWDRIVLEHSLDYVDMISCHAYYRESNGDLGSFLASSTDMAHVIDTIVGVIDDVKQRRGSDRDVNISFDEWNVWYAGDDPNPERELWTLAGKALEDIYSVADAVVVGSLIITLLKHAGRVVAASLAQLVNVIAPIMTETSGPAWRQSTFYPFATSSRLARGVSLHGTIDVEEYDTSKYGRVPLLDGVATHDEDSQSVAVFLVNRSETETIQATVELTDLPVTSILEAESLFDANPYARNTVDDQTRVVPRTNATAALVDGVLTIDLPPTSWTSVALTGIGGVGGE